ncbi:DUF4326 domain-containing protein [Methylibium petroleiphilum]|uniref:DUF4326 domain-containing protein n=1 Tax=Methylibium petroleiphilum (strain ATCC BAA-1232 / LMG 22953 / PM1) TaxID=420662 RepID=A2SNC1_METPP|nr:DUF4326 domain-containing protein [Methylibium petroleiphilum]ABM97060.1 hypothetical protein Mpe_B0285 [Methylibium petroleiphilum PM1]
MIQPGDVRVVSKRKGGTAPEPGEVVIDIDRTNPVLGNRHVLRDHRDAAGRQAVIEAFERDLEADLAAGGPMHAEIVRLATRVLAGERLALRCWCAPDRCHGDPIRDAIRSEAGLAPACDLSPARQAALF